MVLWSSGPYDGPLVFRIIVGGLRTEARGPQGGGEAGRGGGGCEGWRAAGRTPRPTLDCAPRPLCSSL